MQWIYPSKAINNTNTAVNLAYVSSIYIIDKTICFEVQNAETTIWEFSCTKDLEYAFIRISKTISLRKIGLADSYVG